MMERIKGVGMVLTTADGLIYCIYLESGKKITVGRDKNTKGRAWIKLEDTPQIELGDARNPDNPKSTGIYSEEKNI